HTRRGEFQQAVGDCASAIEISPDDATAYCNRAEARSNPQDLDRAYADYTQAIETGNKQPDLNDKGIVATAYNNRGVVEQDRNRLSEAIEDFNQAIQRDPNFVLAYVDRGFARKLHGDLKSAVEDFD